MKIRVIRRPIDERRHYQPEIDVAHGSTRRDALRTLGSGLAVAAAPALILPPSPAQAQLGLALVFLRYIALAKEIWEIGSDIYGSIHGVNRQTYTVEGIILVSLYRGGILEEQAEGEIDVEPGAPCELAIEDVPTKSIGAHIIQAQAQPNRVQKGLKVVQV